jgi:hypothetical protein
VAESAFYIQLINAFLPDLLGLLERGLQRLFRYHVMSNFARTQAYLNAALEPPSFDIPLNVSGNIRTVSLGVLYAPVLPISPMLSLLGLCVSFFTDQFLALHATRKPRAFDVEVLGIVNIVLHMLPLVQMLLIYFVYFQRVLPAFVLGVALWGIVFVTPVRQLARCVRDKNFEPDGAHNVRCALQPGCACDCPARLQRMRGPCATAGQLQLQAAYCRKSAISTLAVQF